MPDSRRELILKAIVALLVGGATPPATVVRGRIDPTSAAELTQPQIGVFALSEDVSREGPTTELRMLKVGFQVLAVGDADTAALDQTLDPVLTYITATLWADVRLGGLALEMQEARVQWGTAADGTDIGGAFLEWDIHYTTRVGDPTQQGAQ